LIYKYRLLLPVLTILVAALSDSFLFFRLYNVYNTKYWSTTYACSYVDHHKYYWIL